MTIKFSPGGVMYIKQSTTYMTTTKLQYLLNRKLYITTTIDNAILQLDPPNIFQVLGHPQNLKYNIKSWGYKIFISTRIEFVSLQHLLVDITICKRAT